MRTFALLLSLMLVPSAFALAQHDEHAEHAEGDAAEAEHGGGDAEAGHHEGHPTTGHVLGLSELQGALVNFSILVLVLVVFGGRKVRASLEERRDRVASELAEATRLKNEAQAAHALYQKRLLSLDVELATIREEMIKAGEAERDRLVAEAEKKAAGMRREGEFLVEQRIKQLKEDLTREAVASAIAAAEKVLREKATPEDQKRLSKAYLAGIGAVAKAGRV